VFPLTEEAMVILKFWVQPGTISWLPLHDTSYVVAVLDPEQLKLPRPVVSGGAVLSWAHTVSVPATVSRISCVVQSR